MTVGGTWGKILHVDLSNNRTWTETLPDDVYLQLIGGRGLVAYFLLRDVPAGADPLGPDNLLIFAPGILQGTNLPGAGRHGVGGKSPLTGALGSAEAGGWWGHEFKRTGYDALIVHGVAPKPVYVWINNDHVEIAPAEHLWGRDVADVQAAIRAERGDERIRVAQCGVAGENKVLVSCIIHDDNRAAGRTGLGAIMGSKNLKAVAVRGTQTLAIADRSRLLTVSKWLGENYKTLTEGMIKEGTPSNVLNLNLTGGLPTRNFQDASFPAAENISSRVLHSTVIKERDTCQACPINCKLVASYDGEDFPDQPDFKTSLKGQVQVDPAYGGPEYETIGAFGSDCGVSDTVAVTKANDLCARWGLDSIGAGATIAFVMELVERGILTGAQSGGFLPRFGDPDAMLAAIDMMAHRRGFGDLMALGSKRLAKLIGNGAEQYLVEVKGQELPMHEPRLKHGLGIGYAIAPTGADHMMSMHDTAWTKPGRSLVRINLVTPVGPLPATDLGAEKMTILYHEANWRHFLDSAVVCMFYPYDYAQLATAMSAVTGHEFSVHDVLDAGERVQQLCRLFNVREGFTAADDRLPQRVMKAFKTGPLAGIEISDAAFLNARQTWYGLMGWTPEGVPTAERLGKLGITALL